MNILIIDDNTTASEILEELFQIEGYGCRSVASGTAAMEAIATSAYDVALVDIRLPDVSGIDVARHLRRELPGIVMVAVTGMGRGYVEEQTQAEALFEMTLEKPISLGELESFLQAVDARLRSAPT